MAKKAAKKKKEKTKKVKFIIFNTPLQSNFRRNARGYTDLFKQLFTDRINVPLQGDRRMILRSQYEGETKNGVSFLYGKIARFTYVEGTNWLDTVSMENKNVTIPKNAFPNPKETDYVFVPSRHFFAVVNNVSFPPGNIIRFLNLGLKKLLDPSENITVSVLQSSDIFRELFAARQVRKIKVKITYTNDDNAKAGSAYMDRLLKRSHIGEYEILAKADAQNNINIEKNKQLSSAIALSQSYGYTDARIVDSDGKKKRIFTEKHPKEFNAEYPPNSDRNKHIAEIVDRTKLDQQE
jgi:hypothetical protein